MTESRRRRRRPPLTAGFTLVELMISIALALLLVIGINAVFKMSSDTVGTGLQVGEATRQFRVVQSVMSGDFDPTHFAPRDLNPALIIESYNQPAFLNRNDELAAINAPAMPGSQQPFNPNETVIDNAQQEMLDVRDVDGNSIYTAATRGGIAPNLYLPQVLNNRNHRVDMLSLFIRNPNSMQRQTPNYPLGIMDAKQGAEYQGYYKSTEAWVVYGHVLQPDNTVNATNLLTFDPVTANAGGQTHFLGLGLNTDAYTNKLYTSGVSASSTNQVNPNNYYASNWVLGRTAMLLGEPTQLDTYVNPYTAKYAMANEPQTYAKDPAPVGTALTQAQISALRPLSWGTPLNATATNAPAGVQIQASQCDVAGISLQTFHDKVLLAENPNGSPPAYLPQWYLPLVSMGMGGAPETPNGQAPNATTPTPASTWIWPTNQQATQAQGRQPWHAYRFMGQAWPDKLAANGATMTTSNIAAMEQQLAVQTPIFLRGCSQFVVEYAGDYLKQNYTLNSNVLGPAGTVYGIGEDGQVDFDVIPDPGNANATIKRIRWYGMTRSLDDGVSVENPQVGMLTTSNAAGATPSQTEIVRPLYRYIQQFTSAPGGQPVGLTHLPFEKINSSAIGSPSYQGFPDTHPQNVDSYTCAWGPLEMDLDQVTAQYANDTGGWAQLYPWVQKNQPTSAFPSRSLLPWMIRVTIRLDDPTGRMPDGQTMQFIYTVPRPH